MPEDTGPCQRGWPFESSRESRRPDKGIPLVPDHTLLRQIGGGSYGEVWLARSSMGVFRAAKIVYRSSFSESRPFERELSGIRQFEPISRAHEGLIDVLHVGINEEAGYFYYVMELGDDVDSGQNIIPEKYLPKTLSTEIGRRGKLPVRECLELGLALSQALTDLHNHKLVHRDIKPANIVFVNGVLKLADIGLVTAVGDAPSYVGTEGFIPPEGPGTPKADIFSLGKVLYEASTGKDRHDFPKLPEELKDFEDCDLFLELNDVMLQACHMDAGKRYSSAWDLHSHLVVVSNGQSVKRLKLLERRFTAFKRVAGIAGIAAIVASLVGYNIYLHFEAKSDARQRQVGSDIAYGNRALETGDLLASLPYFTDVLRLERGNAAVERRDRFRIGSILNRCPKLIHYWFEGREVDSAEFSPDGKKIAVALFDGRAALYDLANDRVAPIIFGQTNWVRNVSFSRDGSRIVTASEDGTACVYDGKTLALISCLQHASQLRNARLSLDGKKVITASLDGIARIWDLESQKVEREFSTGKKLWFADFSPDGQKILTAGEDMAVKLWDLAGNVTTFPHPGWVYHASFSPDGTKIVTACSDHIARVWDISGVEERPELLHEDSVLSAQFSPDGRFVLTASGDGNARLWRSDSLAPANINPILRNDERLTYAGFSPDGSCILLTGYEGMVKIWDLAGGEVAPPTEKCAVSSDGNRILHVEGDNVRIGKTDSDSTAQVFTGTNFTIERVELSRDGRLAMLLGKEKSSGGHTGRVFDFDAGNQLGASLSFPDQNALVAFSDDAKAIVTYDKGIGQIIAMEGSKLLPVPIGMRGPIRSIFFSPSGESIGAQTEQSLRIFDRSNGLEACRPIHLPIPLAYSEFSPDGKSLVVASRDDQYTKCFAQIFDTRTGLPVSVPMQHGDGVTVARFSPNGLLVASGSEDHTAMIWDARTGTALCNPMRHGDTVRDVGFSRSGEWLATASFDHTARIWNAANGDPLTPAFGDLSRLHRVVFLAGDTKIMIQNVSGESRIWKLPVDPRPVEELNSLSGILAGQAPSSIPKSDYASAGRQVTEWNRLRKMYPASFQSSEANRHNWHRFAAEESETNHDWYAVAFHLKVLLSADAANRGIQKRLDRAKAHLDVNHAGAFQ